MNKVVEYEIEKIIEKDEILGPVLLCRAYHSKGKIPSCCGKIKNIKKCYAKISIIRAIALTALVRCMLDNFLSTLRRKKE